MKRGMKYLTILLTGVVVFSSCSKQKYTASFSPSKSKTYTKVEHVSNKEVSSETIVQEAVVSSDVKVVAPVSKIQIVKKSIAARKEIKSNLTESGFTNSEIKQLKKDVRKKVFKEAKKNLLTKKQDGDTQVIAAIISIFIPPLGVWLYQKDITTDFWVSLILWILGWLPGIIYAWLVIFDVLSLA